MCFTPLISLSTAILEWVLALIMFALFRKSKLTPFYSILFFLLGWYQFTEYMLCTTGSLLWVKLGFVGYTFLPALGLHSVLHYFNIKKNIFLIYVVPVLFSVFALLRGDFVLLGQCMTFFVQAITLLTVNPLLSLSYALYYAAYITLAFIILLMAYRHAKTKLEKEIDMSEMLGILFMIIPTFVFIIIFPSLGILFPSVLCHFAVLLALCFFVSAYLDEKKSLHEKFHRKR